MNPVKYKIWELDISVNMDMEHHLYDVSIQNRDLILDRIVGRGSIGALDLVVDEFMATND